MIRDFEEAYTEIEMAKADLNRMVMTTNVDELKLMHDVAIKRIDALYLFYLHKLSDNILP